MKSGELQQIYPTTIVNFANNIVFCWMGDFLLGMDDWIPATSGRHSFRSAYSPEYGLAVLFIRTECGPRLLGTWFVFWPFSILGVICRMRFFPSAEVLSISHECPNFCVCKLYFSCENLVFFLLAAWACSLFCPSSSTTNSSTNNSF